MHILRNRLNLEVERDDGDDQALQILYQVVERAKSLRIRTLLDINHRIDGRALLIMNMPRRSQ